MVSGETGFGVAVDIYDMLQRLLVMRANQNKWELLMLAVLRQSKT